VSQLKVHTHALRLSINDSALFASVDGELGAPTSDVVSGAGDVYPRLPASGVLAALNESAVLLEAVAMSWRLSLLIVEARGVVEVVRCIATAAHLRAVAAAAAPSLAATVQAATLLSRGGDKALDPKLSSLAGGPKKLRAAVGAAVSAAKRDVVAAPTGAAAESNVVRVVWCGFCVFVWEVLKSVCVCVHPTTHWPCCGVLGVCRTRFLPGPVTFCPTCCGPGT
jgi:hypothetical protein